MCPRMTRGTVDTHPAAQGLGHDYYMSRSSKIYLPNGHEPIKIKLRAFYSPTTPVVFLASGLLLLPE